MMKRMPFFFKTCNRQVDYIDRSYSNLQTIPEDIMKFSKTLEELYLNSNQIRELPKSFFRPNKLRKLSLQDNEIQVIPSDISNFVHLVELDMSKNEFEEIPDSIKYCTQLQILDLSNTFITYLSPGVTQLHNLTCLYLNFNSMQELPADFGALVNLQNLELRENVLQTLPVTFGELRNLIRLDLGYNSFKILPAIIGQLSALEELYLDKNQLRQLPGEIGNLRNLKSLDVTENMLESLPEEIILMESLVDLHLSKNLIEQLPDGIGHLLNLSILKLDQNNLLSLNATIGGCSSLQELMLTENSLAELPATMGNLMNLRILNLDLNKLEELPSQICNLNKLGIMSLRNNNLTYLPNEMGRLKKLHVLDVANNQLQNLPYSITSLNLEALWLSENQSHPLLKFQTDYDPKNGNKVLTCFLLPQHKEAFDSRSIENLIDNTLQRFNSMNWEQPRQQSQVKFCYDNEGQIDDDRAPTLVRHATPHPKELKARHQKLFNKENNEPEIVADVEVDRSNEQQMVRSESEASNSSSEMVRRNYESNLITNKTSTVQNLNEIDDVTNQDMMDSYLNGRTDQQYSDERYSERQPSDDEPQQIDYQSESNQDDYTMEENKHVIFDERYDEEVHEEHERADFRANNNLYRCDTPHHLKNKQINSITNKADADKVASILDRLNNQINYEEDSATKPLPVSNTANNDLTYLQPPNNETNLDFEPLEPCEVKQIRFHLSRSPQYGLGLSIAGGRGSTPYRNNDESIFVSNVADKSPAQLAGLQKGDKILSVNDISLEGIEHYTAVRMFKNAGEMFSVLISREVPIHNHHLTSNSFIPYTSLAQLNNKTSNSTRSSFDDGTHSQTNQRLSNNEESDTKIHYATLIRDRLKGIGVTVGYDDQGAIRIDKSDHEKVCTNDRLISINGKDIRKQNMSIDAVEKILNDEGERFIRVVVERN